MKQFIYLVIILSFTSCVDQNIPETIFSMINNSKQDLKIEPFSRNRSNGELSGGFVQGDILEILQNDKITFIREQRDGRTFYSIANIDSVKIIFGNSKFLIFQCNDWPSMENCNTIFRGDSNYEHIITEQDYQDAVPCNGNCE